MMKRVIQFFKQDSLAAGLVATLGSEVLFLVVLAVGLMIAGISPTEHIRWWAGMFLPALLTLRYYAKHHLLSATRAAIVVLFVTFIAFMFYLLKSNTLVLQ